MLAAEAILERGEADIIALARGAMKDPNWAVNANLALGGNYDLWPIQTQRVDSRDRFFGKAQI